MPSERLNDESRATSSRRRSKPRWQQRWQRAARRRPRGDGTRASTCWRCSRIRPAASTWATSATTRSATCWRAFSRARGHRVLHPMGWDAFGLPAEKAAIQRGVAARDVDLRSNIATMREQLRAWGSATTGSARSRPAIPRYYRWEQLFFLQMLERGLAYRKKAEVNWCEQCGTVLANEQVEDDQCWRGHRPVHAEGARAVVPAHHRVRRRAARRPRRARRLARESPHDAAQLDRAQRGRRDRVRCARDGCAADRVHDACRHAVRRDVRELAVEHPLAREARPQRRTRDATSTLSSRASRAQDPTERAPRARKACSPAAMPSIRSTARALRSTSPTSC